MRVTQNTSFNKVRESLNTAKGKMEKLHEQTSTLKKLNTPSDNPVAAGKILEMRTEKVNIDQFTSNAKYAGAYLNSTDSVLDQVSEVLVRAKEIALRQASGASATDSSRIAIAEEVEQLVQRAIGLGNTKIGDRFLFGGYKTETPPFSEKGEYQGDDGQIMIEIAKDVFITLNLTGKEAFNTHPEVLDSNRQEVDPELAQTTPENVNVIDELQNLRITLLTGDTNGIRSTLERLDQMHERVVSARAKVGSRVAGIENTVQLNERHNLTNAKLNSEYEDADMAEVMNNLAKEETVYRSVLGSAQRLIQPTLMDFLK